MIVEGEVVVKTVVKEEDETMLGAIITETLPRRVALSDWLAR